MIKMNELEQFTKKFTDNELDEVRSAKKIGSQFSIIPDGLDDAMKKINKKAFSAGLLLGESRKNRFEPSSSLIDVIAKNTDKKVIVNKKTAWLFLCRRDVFGQGIVKMAADSGFVIVENELGEALGYGEVVGQMSEKGKVVVKNLFDKGAFLRRERRH